VKERALLEDLGVDGRRLLNWIFRQSEGKDKEKWQAFVTPIMNI
jgi:hypothetical protein